MLKDHVELKRAWPEMLSYIGIATRCFKLYVLANVKSEFLSGENVLKCSDFHNF